jgi:hypothetical protein
MTDARPALLDRAILRARAGGLPMQTLLWTLAASPVYVPSGGEPGDDFSGFQPVYYEREGAQMLAVFTTPDGAATLSDLAPHIVAFGGEDLLLRMPAENGLVVNPGSQVGFDVPPLGLSAFRQEITG